MLNTPLNLSVLEGPSQPSLCDPRTSIHKSLATVLGSERLHFAPPKFPKRVTRLHHVTLSALSWPQAGPRRSSHCLGAKRWPTLPQWPAFRLLEQTAFRLGARLSTLKAWFTGPKLPGELWTPPRVQISPRPALQEPRMGNGLMGIGITGSVFISLEGQLRCL